MSESARADAVLALSHELRTPLAVIAGFAELLESRDDERTRLEAAARIGEAVRQLSDALERVLAAVDDAGGDLALRLAPRAEER